MSAGRVILVAVDESDNSRYAFEWLIKEFLREGDEIVLCHIPEMPKLPSFTFKDGLSLPAAEWQKTLQEQIEKTTKLHNDYEHELITRKIKYKVVGEHMKNAGEGIIRYAQQHKANTIVMGTRGLDKIRRTFLGSCSDYVIHHSTIPVMVIPKAD